MGIWFMRRIVLRMRRRNKIRQKDNQIQTDIRHFKTLNTHLHSYTLEKRETSRLDPVKAGYASF